MSAGAERYLHQTYEGTALLATQTHPHSVQESESFASYRYEQDEHPSRQGSPSSEPFKSEKSELAQQGNEETREWVPPMLRLLQSTCLMIAFISLMVILEVFNHLDNTRHGFSVSEHVKTLARYFPTIIVVFLAFFWDMLLKNLKEMAPWSLMAGGWTKAEESLLSVNYVDLSDIKGLVMSVKKRQFCVTLGYAGALLCGALIPFANNLFFIDPIPRTTTAAQTLVRTTRLALNDSFTGNGGITKNSSYFDPQSFLTYMAIKSQNYDFPYWTSQDHAFESFNVSDSVANKLASDSSINMTISTETEAFSVKTTCDPIAYTFSNTDRVIASYFTQAQLLPDKDLFAKANCHIFPTDYPSLSLQTTNMSAWLNYTTCGNWQCISSLGKFSTWELKNCGEKESNDLRLTLNLWNPSTFNGNISKLSNTSATVSGLLCTVGFYLDKYNVKVDARTARLMHVGSEPISSKKLDVKNPESIVLKINQFFKLATVGSALNNQETDYLFPLEVFLDDILSGESSPSLPRYFGPGESGYFPGAVRPDANPYEAVRIDAVMAVMSNGNRRRLAGYSKNTTEMATDFSSLLQGLVSQIVHTSYRLPDNSPMPGFVTSATLVLRLRQVSLRALEGLLATLAIITILSSTILRPRTDLRSDPRSLGAIGILLSRSPGLEVAVQGTGAMSTDAFLDHLKGSHVKTAVTNGHTIIQIRESESKRTKSESAINKPSNGKTKRYRKTSLHWTYRTMLILTAAAMIVGLGISWWQNHLMSGYAATSREKSYAIIFVPSALLVLLGYATNSMDSAIQSLQPYVQLSKNPLQARVGLGRTPITYSAFTIGYKSFVYNRSVLLIFSSCIRFLITIIKIVAAALFVTELRSHVILTNLSVDSSLVSHLGSYRLTDPSNPQEDILKARAMTLLQFAPNDRTSSAPIGLADGIVFGNISNVVEDSDISSILDSGADIKLRIPAIQITPICESFAIQDYDTFTPSRDIDGNPQIRLGCKKSPRMMKCPSQTLQKSFNTSSDHNPNDIEYYWNRDFLYSTDGPSDSESWNNNYVRRSNVTSFLLARASGANSTVPNFKVTDVASFWCNMNITPIRVDVTANRVSRAVLDVQEIQPLAVKSYNPESIKPMVDQKPYEVSQLNFTNMVDGASFRSIYALNGRNILYNIIRMENPNVTDNDFVRSPELLAKAGGQVAVQFAAQMINLARPYVDPMTPEQSKASVVTAEVTTTRQRLIQNKNITITLQILLGVVLLCLLVVVLGVTTKVGIAKPPNSIGAQAALMADSELVKLVKDEIKTISSSVEKSDMDLWRAWEGCVVSLGWWNNEQPATIAGGLEEGSRKQGRYGIDIGRAEMSHADLEDRWR